MQTERQIQIIEASLELIAHKGIQGFTIKNLSKEIGISEPAIYRHFDSKTEILLTILNNFKEMASFLGGIMDSNQGTAFEKIDFMFSRIIDIFMDTPSFISVIFSEELFRNEQVLQDKVVEILDMNEHTIENIIQKGQNSQEIRTDIDSKTLALIVMGSLRFSIKVWELKGVSQNLKEEGDKLIGNLQLILTK